MRLVLGTAPNDLHLCLSVSVTFHNVRLHLNTIVVVAVAALTTCSASSTIVIVVNDSIIQS